MQDSNLQFLAVPSITMPDTWVGIVVARTTGAVLKQTTVSYRRPDEARFGARRSWITFRRTVEHGLRERA